MTTQLVYFGLGTNLGNKADNLERALAALGSEVGQTVARSSFYDTEPLTIDGSEQPSYVNAAVAIRTDLEPHEVLKRALEIERTLGRERVPGNRWGPRVIDIDILLFGSRVLKDPDLVVPHPELLRRDFVLVPLLELDPLLIHPVTGERLADVLEHLKDRFVVKKLEGNLPR